MSAHHRPDWMHGEDERDHFVYSIDHLRASVDVEVRDLSGGWLVLKRDATDSPSRGLWLRFAVLEFFQSDVGGANPFGACLFFGDGPVGNLRECRHTYWGEDGYVFGPNGKLIVAALRALSEFYDDLWEGGAQ